MNDNKGNNSGFLLGLILGGAVVFLLGTEKGRSILKAVTDEGMSELSDILEEVEEDEQEEYEEPSRVVKAEKVSKSESVEEVASGNHASSTPVKRRFFRRAKS